MPRGNRPRCEGAQSEPPSRPAIDAALTSLKKKKKLCNIICLLLRKKQNNLEICFTYP